MPAKYVRAYSKGQKTDFRDAEAIAEAVQRPTMKFVALRSGRGARSGIGDRRLLLKHAGLRFGARQHHCFFVCDVKHNSSIDTNHPVHLSIDEQIRGRSYDRVENDTGHDTIELDGVLKKSLAPAMKARRGQLRLIATPQEIG
jgi:hypothetical protein